MICWLDISPWKTELATIPAALHEREILRRQQFLNSIIPMTSGGTEDGIDYAAIALNSFDIHKLFTFFEASGTCAVTLEAADFYWLFGGKNPVSLAATRGAQNGQLNLPYRIGTDELVDTLTEIRRAIVNGGPSDEESYYSTPELDKAMAEEDLVSSGLLSREDLDVDLDSRIESQFIDGRWQPVRVNQRDREAAELERSHDETRDYIRQTESEIFDPFSSNGGDSW